MQETSVEKIIGITTCVLAPIVGLIVALVSYGPIFPAAASTTSQLNPSPTQVDIGQVNTLEVIKTIPTRTEFPRQLTFTETPIPSGTLVPTSTPTIVPTETQTPLPTIIPSATPQISLSGYSEECEPVIYSGIRHCTLGPYEILRIDPKHPDVRFETVLPMGFDRYGTYGECRDVYLPDTIDPNMSPGPGCHNGSTYPGEQVGYMASRYPGAVAAFNGDFFSPTYAYGPIGLTVKKGERLDGYFDDQNARDLKRSSVSISKTGDIRIGLVDREIIANLEEPWTWTPDPDEYYNTIGGLPLLVQNGHPVDLHNRCILEEGWCPDPNIPRARTAFGRTFEGEAIVLVAPEEWGVTLQTLSFLMVELGASVAINLDGGGSSQLWYAGEYLISSTRPVAEGMLIFSSSSTLNFDHKSLFE